MKSLTIRLRILMSFGLILAVMMTVGVAAWLRLSSIEREAAHVQGDAIPGLVANEAFKDALTSDYMLSARSAAGGDARASHDALRDTLGRFEATVNSADERQHFDQLKLRFDDYVRARDGGAGGLDAAFTGVLAEARTFTASDSRFGYAAAGRVNHDLTGLGASLIVCVLAVLLIALVSGTLLMRAIMMPLQRLAPIMDAMRGGDFTQRMPIERHDEFGDLADGFNRMADDMMELVGQVQKSGIRVSTSMTEIAATAKQQQATATEVAATTTEIGATSREISATSKELARTMNEVTTVAERAADLASSGQTELSHMEGTMAQIMDAAASINAKLAVLNEKAGGINQVVTTITKVADQTNLLSLNAAIEAEKAGEYGRGFAVVSSEIRRLADQTAVATYDIEQMVTEIQAAVSAGVMGMDKFAEEVRRGMHDVHEIGGKLSDVIQHVQTLAPRFETVNDGMEAQATGAEQISEALQQLSEATQQTVESLRQSSSAIDDLSQVSGNLHGSISRFRLATG
ncbi:MAG: methyl-accepting chemotaxis protein [Sphingomonas oligoaromativorans]